MVLQSAYQLKPRWVFDNKGTGFEFKKENMMMKRFTYRSIALLFVICALASCHSRRKIIGIEEGWQLLSTRKVNFVRDKDEVVINNRTLYTALRFKVEKRDITISDLEIHFQNGDKLEPRINEDIKAGEFSRVIELGREGRYIDHIDFKYRTTGNILNGRATVLILGEKYYRGY